MRKVNQNMPTVHAHLLLDSRYQNTEVNSRFMMLENAIVLIVYFNIKQYKICLAWTNAGSQNEQNRDLHL